MQSSAWTTFERLFVRPLVTAEVENERRPNCVIRADKVVVSSQASLLRTPAMKQNLCSVTAGWWKVLELTKLVRFRLDAIKHQGIKDNQIIWEVLAELGIKEKVPSCTDPKLKQISCCPICRSGEFFPLAPDSPHLPRLLLWLQLTVKERQTRLFIALLRLGLLHVWRSCWLRAEQTRRTLNSIRFAPVSKSAQLSHI